MIADKTFPGGSCEAAGARPELVSPVFSESELSAEGKDDGFAELEDVFPGSNPEKDFRCVGWLVSFSKGDPELLPAAEDQLCEASAEVIFEKDGIPYIDDDACGLDGPAKEKLDGDFAKLVEAVVYSRGPS